ncbi:MAG: phosphodiesterase [Pararhodobacter sp.]|nr:phosphodiesterase [Pararhodobacter sp.]
MNNPLPEGQTPPRLPPAFLEAPIAHRGLHDLAEGRPENGAAAITAAVAAGYGIEIDLQLSADWQAMVFHDDTLDRMTEAFGPISSRNAAALQAIPLRGGQGEGIPTLPQVLQMVAGRVPLLIELKDQPADVPGQHMLEQATAAALEGYPGPVAVMSFNPAMVAAMAQLAPAVPRGLTTCGFDADSFPNPTADPAREALRQRLVSIADYDATGACFISHDWRDLARPRVAALKAQGAAVLCWTIRSAEQEREARRVAQNITFEQYLPPVS